VAQAIPVYAMSVFQISKGVCKRMTDAIAQFWWGDDEKKNALASLVENVLPKARWWVGLP
jgi:hypothetical protein